MWNQQSSPCASTHLRIASDNLMRRASRKVGCAILARAASLSLFPNPDWGSILGLDCEVPLQTSVIKSLRLRSATHPHHTKLHEEEATRQAFAKACESWLEKNELGASAWRTPSLGQNERANWSGVVRQADGLFLSSCLVTCALTRPLRCRDLKSTEIARVPEGLHVL
jgi:hypothetical protein